MVNCHSPWSDSDLRVNKTVNTFNGHAIWPNNNGTKFYWSVVSMGDTCGFKVEYAVSLISNRFIALCVKDRLRSIKHIELTTMDDFNIGWF